MTNRRHPITSEEQWHQLRARHVGGSEIAALFGCHPYITALQLYAEKTGAGRSAPDAGVLERGHILEPAVAEMARRKRPDWRIEKATDYLSNPDWGLGCTPDFWVHCPRRGPGILQCKTVAKPIHDEGWADGPPLWVLLQTLQEQMLGEVTWGAVGVLVTSTYTLAGEIHEFERHEATEAKIVAAARKFWDELGQGRAPQADYARDDDAIRALYPRDNGQAVDLTGDNRMPALLEEYESLQAMGKHAEKKLSAVKAEIAEKLGEAAAATLPGWELTFKTQERKGYVVKPSSCRVLRVKRVAAQEMAA